MTVKQMDNILLKIFERNMLLSLAKHNVMFEGMCCYAWGNIALFLGKNLLLSKETYVYVWKKHIVMSGVFLHKQKGNQSLVHLLQKSATTYKLCKSILLVAKVLKGP